MIRDDGPKFQLGFGVTSDDINFAEGTREGPHPESGVISKALHDHPVMRFFATAAVTLVGMHVGGKVVREGGLRLGYKLQESGKPWVTNAIRDVRTIQKQMDQWQGVKRIFRDGADDYATSSKLFVRDPQTGRISTDVVDERTGFLFTKAEIEAGRTGFEGPTEWTMKREIQQKMVRSARRLPYELPAAYMVQRGLTDKLFGSEDEFEGKWYNPVDVVTDFVNTSIKNTALMVAPFEVGGAAASHSYRKMMSLADDFTNASPRQLNMAKTGIVMQDVLGRVGHDAVSLLHKGVKLSSQSTGALSAGLNEARQRSHSIVELLHDTRSARSAALNSNHSIIARAVDKFHRQKQVIMDLGPGPFRGMGTGFRKAQEAWTDIGRGYDAFESLMTLGKEGFERDIQAGTIGGKSTVGWTEALNRRLQGSGTTIEELSNQIGLLGGGGTKSKAFGRSVFFRSQTQNEYTRILHRQIMKSGASKEAADDFIKKVHVTAPSTGDFVERLTNRIKFGDDNINTDQVADLFSQIYQKVGSQSSGFADEAAFKAGFRKSIDTADSLFSNADFQTAMRSKVRQQWQFMEERVLPDAAASVLGRGRPSWSSFGPSMDKTHATFLKRKTAELTGLKITDTQGRVINEAFIDEHLRRMKFDPVEGLHEMKAFLGKKGAISKPWTKEGFNIFGMRQITVQEALNKGYFQGSQHSEKNVQRVLNRIKSNDPMPLGEYTIGGMYVSRSGRVVDFNRMKKGVSKFLGDVSAETQIPLIHLSPFELFGTSARMDRAERSILQYVPGMSNQAFLGRGMGRDDFHVWVKGTKRGSKGRVFSVGLDSGGYIRSQRADGWYQPLAAKAANIASRHARMAIGDMGKGAGPTPEPNQNSWISNVLGANNHQRAFDRVQQLRRGLRVDPDQPDSVFRAVSRFRRRSYDINNRVVMSKLLRDGRVKTGRGILHLNSNGEVLDEAGEIVFSKQSVADAFEKFSSSLRNDGFAPKILDRIGSANQRLQKVFSFNAPTAQPKTFGLGPKGEFNVTSLNSTGQILEAGNIIARSDDALLSSLTPERRQALQRAQETLLWRHIRESGSTRYWERAIPGSRAAGSIHTRIDQFKTDILKYMMIRSSITNQAQYAGAIPDILTELTNLKSAGRISQAEFTEARSALLSAQINVESFLGYGRGKESLDNVIDVVSGIRQSVTAKSGLTDIAEGRSSTGSNLLSPLRRRFGMADYDSPGGEYSPFGNTNTVFRPTFGTAFNRSPRRALGSVLGVNTWNDPEVFSGASVPMGHLIERLNRYQGTFGMGLDVASFSGPLDMFARGMVGYRALPLVAAGTAALAVDRTIGGYMQPTDMNGERVYSPFLLGTAARVGVEAQAAVAALPGGMSYEERREQLLEGEVAIRAGRWWPLGNTPFEGGRIQYYRPSWYRRLMSGYTYTDQTHGSPLERLAFGYDFSPLRPFDPYRFERQHYYDRPYPETGDYFTGPWGPLTPALNATVGKVLKPRITMHQEELAAGLAGYSSVGEGGAYLPSGMMTSGGYSPGGIAGAQNSQYATAGQYSLGTASNLVTSDIRSVNTLYSSAAGGYGVGSSMRPRIISGQEPISRGSAEFQFGELGYRAQELFGIYGFGFAAARESLGFGDKDLNPSAPVLASASAAYGSTRGFWDLNIGGLGDFPTPAEGDYANLELSEIVRRFVPKERSGTETINPIPNMMSVEHPWLPGSDYYINFMTGDPYTAVQEGEMRLPGLGYERLHGLNSDATGRYGIVDRHKILGDVAPWSTEYRQIDNLINSETLSGEQMRRVEMTRAQVAAKAVKNEFTPYEYRYSSAAEMLQNPTRFAVGRAWEWMQHRDSYFNTKFMPTRTAVEDWEREHVYGSTFPQWEDPISDFLNPIAYKSTQRNPISAASMAGVVGSLFGRTGRAKAITGFIGGAIGFGAATYGNAYEAVTGERFMPAERRKQVALEEYVDILTYTKNMRLASQARAAGDAEATSLYVRQAKQTMYGADIYSTNINELVAAVPKRKREHFRSMLTAPEQERDQILSTAGRLERRMLQAAWGRQVEERPDLGEYFQEHELPADNWEGWHPNTNMEDVKIKIAQSMGIELSEMGYYPQQIREANLINPSYPDFSVRNNNRNVQAQLRALLSSQGINGDVIPVRTPYPGERVQISGGLFAGV